MEDRIVKYWSERSSSFLSQRRRELHDPISDRWMELIHTCLSGTSRLKVLDVGCGAGYFSILLAKEGHSVKGVDITGKMIEAAVILAREEKADCDFYKMDAMDLDFQDGSFDLVISRNLTWTLTDPERAYREWLRVLKQSGHLINIDADYGHEPETTLPAIHAHHMLSKGMIEENEEIKRSLSISTRHRPAWDRIFLMQTGISRCDVYENISERIYIHQDEFYNPTPLFMIHCVK